METLFSLTLGSYLLLTIALWTDNGGPNGSAQLFAVASLGCLILAFVTALRNPIIKKGSFNILKYLVVGILLSYGLALQRKPALYFNGDLGVPEFLPFLLMSACLVLLAYSFREKPEILDFIFILVLLVFAGASLWVLHYSPEPVIDVWTTQQGAAQAILSGQNPYTLTYAMPRPLPGVVHDNRFVYPPFTFLLTAPFFYAFGDIRMANLVCQLLAGIFLYLICVKVRKNKFEALLICTLFLFNPRWFFVLEQAWTEPTLTCLVFGAVFCFLYGFKKIGWFFGGLLLGAKQFMLPFAPLLWRFFPSNWRQWIWGILGLAAITVPFVWWGPHDFYAKVIGFHLARPIRMDALTLTVILLKYFNRVVPTWVPLSLMGATVLLGLKSKRNYMFPIVAALAYFFFFWFNKVAFINYYFFISSLLVLALALIPNREPGEATESVELNAAITAPRSRVLAYYYLILANLAVILFFVFARMSPVEVNATASQFQATGLRPGIIQTLRLYWSLPEDIRIYYRYASKTLGYDPDIEKDLMQKAEEFIVGSVILQRGEVFYRPAPRHSKIKIFKGNDSIRSSKLQLIDFHPPSEASEDLAFILAELPASAAMPVVSTQGGLVPYRDFLVEYPPFALIPMVYARMLSHDFISYARMYAIFVGMAVLLSLGFAYLIHRKVGDSPLTLSFTDLLLFTFLAMFAIGPVFATRLDIFVAAAVVLALWAFLEERYVLSTCFLAAGILIKIFPAIFIPLIALTLIQKRRYQTLSVCTLVFIAVMFAVNYPIYQMTSGKYLDSFLYHVHRPIEIGSYYANGLFLQKLLANIPLYVRLSFGSTNLASPYERYYLAFSKFAPVLLMAALYACYWLKLKRTTERQADHLKINFFILLILAFIITCKVFSPQFVIWLFPLAFLAQSRRPRLVACLYLLTCFFSQIIYPKFFPSLSTFEPSAIGLLTARNILMLALFVLLWRDTMANLEPAITETDGISQTPLPTSALSAHPK